LDAIESDLLKEFEQDPPSSIPEAVSQIKEKFGITLTETPVRYWLRKKCFVTSNQSQYRQKQICVIGHAKIKNGISRVMVGLDGTLKKLSGTHTGL